MILNHSSDAMGNLGLGAILGFIGASYIVYCLGVGLYNITLHPLAKLPGPKFRHAFHIAKFWDIWTGYNVHTSKELHDKYGPTVRISPDNVSFNNEEAWAAIYGSRQEKKQIPKNTDFYLADKREKVVSIISAGDVDHSRMRRALSHAFSDAAVREQEPILNSYFDLLIQKLHEKIGGPSKGEVNLVRWYNFTTFDIIGDLSFQESFEALRTEEYNFWIANIFKGIKFARIFAILNAYPLIGTPLLSFLALFPQLQGAKKRHEQYTVKKTARRLEAETNRNDFLSYILRHNDEKGLSKAEILNMANLLIIAGSETTATLLSGATFHLLKHPAAMEKLVNEIRTSFPDPAEMTFASLSKLKYLHACIQEGFRMYPPVPILLPRKTVQSTVINGYFIPENTSVGVHQWSAYHSEANFLRPEEYIPERWLGDPRFAKDKRGVLQPFSVGSRNCIGQHLALVEMKAILARVLWHFDISLREDSDNWAEQKVFFLWDKGDLNVRLSVRK